MSKSERLKQIIKAKNATIPQIKSEPIVNEEITVPKYIDPKTEENMRTYNLDFSNTRLPSHIVESFKTKQVDLTGLVKAQTQQGVINEELAEGSLSLMRSMERFIETDTKNNLQETQSYTQQEPFNQTLNNVNYTPQAQISVPNNTYYPQHQVSNSSLEQMLYDKIVLLEQRVIELTELVGSGSISKITINKNGTLELVATDGKTHRYKRVQNV